MDIHRIARMESNIDFLYGLDNRIVGYRYTFQYIFEEDNNGATNTG
ncbi:MAG: hypothetical protein ACYTFW_00975 [Planctomycetota bacterium]